MCIDIVEIFFGIAHWRISSAVFDKVICLRHENGGVLSFHILLAFKVDLFLEWMQNNFKGVTSLEEVSVHHNHNRGEGQGFLNQGLILQRGHELNLSTENICESLDFHVKIK